MVCLDVSPLVSALHKVYHHNILTLLFLSITSKLHISSSALRCLQVVADLWHKQQLCVTKIGPDVHSLPQPSAVNNEDTAVDLDASSSTTAATVEDDVAIAGKAGPSSALDAATSSAPADAADA